MLGEVEASTMKEKQFEILLNFIDERVAASWSFSSGMTKRRELIEKTMDKAFPVKGSVPNKPTPPPPPPKNFKC